MIKDFKKFSTKSKFKTETSKPTSAELIIIVIPP